VISFEHARRVARQWLDRNCPGASMGPSGFEDADYWDVDWEPGEGGAPDGLPIMLVSKATGCPVVFFPQVDPSILDRCDAMRPIAA
jgi:hypothetical protein